MDIIVILVIVLLILFLTYKNVVDVNDPKNNSFVEPQHRLITLLRNISRADKVILKDVNEKWSLNRNVIDTELNQKITKVIENTLNSIQSISQEKFHIKSIENVYLMKDKFGDFRLIINSFIHDVKNFYTIKLVMDITSINETIYINYIDIDETALNNILNKYDIRWQSQGILSKYNMFDEDTVHLLNDHYRKNYNMIELNRESFTIDTSNTFTMDQLTSMYLPADTPNTNSPVFCEKNKFEWDSKSIPISTDNKCVMHNSSKQPYPNEPYDVPGVVTQRVDENSYSWMRNQTNFSEQ
jgi:hypothetical protein